MRRTRLAAALTAALLTTTAAVTGAAAGLATEAAAPPQPAFALPNGLALTPPMGFNNWNTTDCRAEFNEAMVKGIADIFVGPRPQGRRLPVRQPRRLLGAAAAQRAGQPRARPGPLPERHQGGRRLRPRQGLEVRHLHQRRHQDLQHGRASPAALGPRAAATRTCSPSGASTTSSTTTATTRAWTRSMRYTKMRDALASTGRPIVYSICEWGQNQPWDVGAGRRQPVAHHRRHQRQLGQDDAASRSAT